MVETQRPWEDLIRQLHAGFRQIDEERALLRDIDQAIVRSTVLNGEGTDLIEHTFLESLRRFSQIHRLTEPGLCYVYTGDTLELLDDPDCLPSRPTSLPTCPAIKMLTHLSEQPCRCVALLRNPDTEVLYSKLAGTKFAVVCPVFSPLKQLLCLLLFLDNEIMEGSDLGSGEFEQSLASVGTQLSIAYEHVWRAQQNTRMRELWDLFLSADLSPSKCFKQLASAIPDFLPQFGPLRLPTPPGVQILVPASLSEDDKPTHLVIRATTANEPDTTRIDISKSITGLLVERSPEELPYFCDDPHRTVYGERYRNYLSASKDAQVRTEFAVRLKGKDDKLVGILNLESAIDNAFNIHHRKAIVDLLPHIAP